MTKYLISLKPLTPYFFGGENTFGNNNQNYFVRSNYLPQQTTLLGFLRHELLLQNNLIGTNPKENDWASLIGEKSFQKEDGMFVSEFGAIKKISPVFLSNQMESYIPQAMDWAMAGHLQTEKNDRIMNSEILRPLALSYFENGITNLEGKSGSVPVLLANGEPYDAKLKLKSLWVNSTGSKQIQWDFENRFKNGQGFENGLFIQRTQVGINRKINRTKDDSGDFYRQVYYQLAEDFAFSFFANLDLPAEKKIHSRLVTMGGEKSAFEMTVTETTDSFEDRFNSKTFTAGHLRNSKAVVLTSDAFIETEISNICDFAITDVIPFRNIATISNKVNDYVRIRGGNLSKTSDVLFLLKRGSIFYAKDLSQLTTALENKAFETIGYNQYVKINN
jgi:CRISPR-associated protein Cmr3